MTTTTSTSPTDFPQKAPTTVDDTPSTDTAKTADRHVRVRARQVTIRLSTIIVAVIGVALLATSVAFAALYRGAHTDIARRDARAADDAHAQQVATDYAVAAATIDFHDTKSWFDRLKADTTPQLAAKFDAAAPELDQILLPLQWTSTATPITSTVTSRTDSAVHVDVFLSVNSTSVQTPQGGVTTVCYTMTIDRDNGWKIAEVGGGLDAALPNK